MSFSVYGTGRLGVQGGIGTVRVVVYEVDGALVLGPTVNGVVELPSLSGFYAASQIIPSGDPRPLWMQFDGGFGSFDISQPYLCGATPSLVMGFDPSLDQTTLDEIADAVAAQARFDATLDKMDEVSQDSWQRFNKGLQCAAFGTVGAGSTDVLVVTSSLSPVMGSAGQFKNRSLIFLQTTPTVNLRGVGKEIIAGGTTTNIPVTQLPAVPASGDLFIIN